MLVAASGQPGREPRRLMTHQHELMDVLMFRRPIGQVRIETAATEVVEGLAEVLAKPSPFSVKQVPA
jgi:hypothetical protein